MVRQLLAVAQGWPRLLAVAVVRSQVLIPLVILCREFLNFASAKQFIMNNLYMGNCL